MNKDTRQYVRSALEQFGPVTHETLDMYEDAWSGYSDVEILEALRSWNRDKERGGKRFAAALIIERMDIQRQDRQRALPPPDKKPTRRDCLGRGCKSIRCERCNNKPDIPKWAWEAINADIAQKKAGIFALKDTPVSENGAVNLGAALAQALSNPPDAPQEEVENSHIDPFQAILDDESYDQYQGSGWGENK